VTLKLRSKDFYMPDAKRIEIVLPLPPSANALWRVAKNGRVYATAPYKNWKAAAMWEAAAQAHGVRISGAYRLTLQVVAPDKRRRDLDNLLKATSDMLQSAGLIENDHFCRALTASWETEGPQCKIIIESMEG
jgi:crossover junction endodeoxyribonuclease RusA